MKKIQLSIPKPCHENWDAMAPNEKGKFCASCQKGVIDFTSMNDRQIAEFFKKLPSSVCGRFQPHQLGRDIDIPRKRIPWIKYFFQFSLPAFLISMKAGAQVGKVAVKMDTISIAKSKKSSAEVKNPEGFNLRKTTSSIQSPQHFSLSCDISTEKNKIPELKLEPPNDVNITQQLQGAVGGVVILGGVSSKKNGRQISKSQSVFSSIIDSTVGKLDTLIKKISVYPNPVQRNSSIRIDLKNPDAGIYTISLINSNGEIIQAEERDMNAKNRIMNLSLRNVAAGTYFIHLFNRKTTASYSEKIIVQ